MRKTKAQQESHKSTAVEDTTQPRMARRWREAAGDLQKVASVARTKGRPRCRARRLGSMPPWQVLEDFNDGSAAVHTCKWTRASSCESRYMQHIEWRSSHLANSDSSPWTTVDTTMWT